MSRDGHEFFELTYANYLVLPRSLMQSMPDHWQTSIVQLLDQLRDAYSHVDIPVYEVKALAGDLEWITPFEPCPDCDGTSYELGDDCPTCAGWGEIEAESRRERPDEVGYRDDPIPHYNRGRTHVTQRPGWIDPGPL